MAETSYNVASRRSGGYGTADDTAARLYSVLTAFDITNPAAPVVLQDFMMIWNGPDNGAPLITAIALFEQGGKKYIIGAGNSYLGNGTPVIDVTDPSNMSLTAFVPNTLVTPNNQGHGVTMINNGLAVLGNYNATSLIRAIDLTDPKNPIFGAAISRVSFPSTNAWHVRHIGNGIVVGAHGSGQGSAFTTAVNGLSVSDFSDPNNPILIAQIATPKADLTTVATADWPHVQVEAVTSKTGKRYALLDNAVLGAYILNITELNNPIGLGNIGPETAVKGIRTFTFNEDKSLLFMADGPYPASNTGKGIYCMRVNWKW